MPQPRLFQPLSLRGITTPNRIVLSPMCQYSAVDGIADDWHLVHLGKFAQGGAGIVMVEATAVTAEGRITHGDLGLWNEAQQAPLARIAAYASAGLEPTIMGMGPVPASKLCLHKAGWTADQLDLMEINEAFAAQACAVNKEMGWDTSKINVNGGAIAIGHPIGASGCRVLVTLIHEMIRRDARRGLASLCIGGGMGVALAIER